jgi:hypothetical protein
MPNFTSPSNSNTMVTSGLSAAEELPTSPNSNWRDSRYSVTDYSRRAGVPQRATSGTTALGQQLELVTGAEALAIDSGSDIPVNSFDSNATTRIVGLQKWAGQICSVEKGLFTVELRPLDHDGPTLFADFDLRLLAPDEREAKPGAIVYLTTRMIQGDSGRVEAVTNVRLRHPRRWSRAELNEVKQRGRDRARSFAKYASRGTSK